MTADRLKVLQEKAKGLKGKFQSHYAQTMSQLTVYR